MCIRDRGAQVAQGTLGDVDHDAGVEPGGEDAHHIDAADAHQCTGQRCKACLLYTSEPAVAKSPRRMETPMLKASSTSTSSLRRHRQHTPFQRNSMERNTV